MIRPVGEGTLTTSDGRTLAYVARGAQGGFPVIVSHGTPGSRYARHPDPELYERHGVKAVAYDRPGYGRSDPQLGRSVADAPADIAAIADELGFERFAVVGGSGGAPHALACGALLADRLDHLGDDVERRRHAVELAAAVVRDDHRCRAVLGREQGVLRGQQSLDHQRQRADRAQPLEVAPGERVVDDRVERLVEVLAPQRLWQVRERQVVRQREARAHVPLAAAGDRQVDGQHQR